MHRIRSMKATLGVALMALFTQNSCYILRSSAGGGQVKKPKPASELAPGDVLLPEGFVIERIATGLSFPTGVAIDEKDTIYVTEAGYSYGEVFTEPRLLRIEPGARISVVARGDNPPWNGVVYHDGALFVAEGGELKGGRILRISPEGSMTALVEGLPSYGDHHTDGPAVGPDGYIYFGQGTATNSGVVGVDNFEFGWPKRHPNFHDIPCKDITLSGHNFTTDDPRRSGQKAETGAYSPFGTPTTKGQRIEGRVPCSGAVMRVPAKGGNVELVAWGFRNPYGLAFSPDGKLYITENGFDERGSRPIYGAGDYLWHVTPNTWYGFPDFAGGEPVATERYKPPGKEIAPQLLQTPPGPVPRPAAQFGVHSSSNGLDFSRNASFGYKGDVFVAQFGDMAPQTGKVLSPVGFKVVRVDVRAGVVEDFATNRGSTNGPSSYLKTNGLERPIAVRFDPRGLALYVVDFGIVTMSDKGPAPRLKTGALFRIRRRP